MGGQASRSNSSLSREVHFSRCSREGESREPLSGPSCGVTDPRDQDDLDSRPSQVDQQMSALLLPVTEEDEGDDQMREWMDRHPSTPASGDTAILQFSCMIYFVEESEGEAVIDIMRLGNQRGCVACSFLTKDGSGKSGERYEAARGRLVFEDGESQKTISIGIIDSDRWSTTLEFKVCLTNAEECELGAYLHTCRVKVIDNDTFPSSKYREVGQGSKAIRAIGSMALFWEYCKMNFKSPGIAWRTIASLCFDQLKNVYLFYKLSALAYMLNVLFNADVDLTIHERAWRSYYIGAGYILPMFILHAWDLAKVRIDLSGHSRCFLQQNIVRKYLNFNMESRMDTPTTDLQLAVREDSAEIAEGYMAVLAILKLVGKLIVMLSFTISSAPNAVKYVIAMPALMLLFGRSRNMSLHDANELPSQLGSELLAYVGDIANNYPLIANYQQRPKINEGFSLKLAAWRSATLSPATVRVNNDYFTQWLGPVFTGFYIMTHALAVITGDLAQGTFIATLGVFSELSGDFSEGFKELMKINTISSSLSGMTEMLNRTTDLKDWKKVNRQRRASTKDERRIIIENYAAHPFPTDKIPFRLKKMGYAFPDSENLFENVSLSIEQGQTVAVLGGHGNGRQSLLRLIAHDLFPTEGEIFIPSHLRILHVSQQTYILNSSLLFNLTFGCGLPYDKDRVKTILKRIKLEKMIQDFDDAHEGAMDTHGTETVAKDFDGSLSSFINVCSSCGGAEQKRHERADDSSWQKKLSYTDICKLHLARALIMNPEVMVLQRPLLHFNTAEQRVVLDLISEHVKNRGLELDPETASVRRPRSVFLSLEDENQAAQMDITWKLESMNGKSTIVECKDYT